MLQALLAGVAARRVAAGLRRRRAALVDRGIRRRGQPAWLAARSRRDRRARPRRDSLGLCVFARSAHADYELVVRAFPAGVGIVEDPASGAANGLIAAWIALREPHGALARGYRVSQGREIGRDASILSASRAMARSGSAARRTPSSTAAELAKWTYACALQRPPKSEASRPSRTAEPGPVSP